MAETNSAPGFKPAAPTATAASTPKPAGKKTAKLADLEAALKSVRK